jgi:hypothetical protein
MNCLIVPAPAGGSYNIALQICRKYCVNSDALLKIYNISVKVHYIGQPEFPNLNKQGVPNNGRLSKSSSLELNFAING